MLPAAVGSTILILGPSWYNYEICKKVLPAAAGSTFSIFIIFHKIALETQIEHAAFKKVLPAAAGSTFSIFTNFEFIAIMMHIDCASKMQASRCIFHDFYDLTHFSHDIF